MSQIEEKLIEPPLIEKSTDPPSCCAGAAVVAHVKRLARIGVGWGEFRCQRECETNRCVRVCARVCAYSAHSASKNKWCRRQLFQFQH